MLKDNFATTRIFSPSPATTFGPTTSPNSELTAPGLSELVNPLTVLQIEVDMATEFGMELTPAHLNQMQKALAELTEWYKQYKTYLFNQIQLG